MSDLMRAMIDAALPAGSIWRPEPDGDLDKLLDGTAENLETVRLFLSGIKDVRNPALTDYLGDLEREFGVLTNLSLTDAQRRSQLHPLVYGRGGGGTIDDLQAALDNAGFSVIVHANDPATDPAIFLDQDFQMVAGGGTAYAGNAGAFAGRSGGELVVNGDIFKMSRIFTSVAGNLYAGAGHGAGEYVDLLRSKVEYPIPTDPGDWPLVFFVGGATAVSHYIEGQDLFVGGEVANLQACRISHDGKSMFVVGPTGLVYRWALDTPFNTATAAPTLPTLDVFPQVGIEARGMAISDDGRHLFINDRVAHIIHSWTMASPNDLSTAIYDGVGASKDISAHVAGFIHGVALNSDGTKFFTCNASTGLLQSWTMGTPYIPSTGVYDGDAKSKDIFAQENTATDLSISRGGWRISIVGTVQQTISTYDMSVKDDLSTAIHIPELDIPVSGQDGNPRGLTASPDGALLYLGGAGNDTIFPYTATPKITSIALAQVPAAQEQAFKRIILSKKPAHSWAGLIVVFS